MASKKQESTRTEVVRVYGPTVGGALEAAGLVNVKAVKAASDEKLLAISGVDAETLAKLREMDMVAPKPKDEKADKEYWIVNPAGAVHCVTRTLAGSLLRRVGYRMASAEQVQHAKRLKVQRFDRPIAERWKPEPEKEPELE